MDAIHILFLDDLDMNGPLLRNDQDAKEKIIYKYVYNEFMLYYKEFVHQDQLCVSKVYCV